MLITDQFVFVHLPKTGGMFVDETLKEVLVPNLYMRKLHSLRSRHAIRIPGLNYRYYSCGRHKSCAGIPEWAKQHSIFGVIRNPYDWYVSDYRFGLWKKPGSLGHWWRPTTAPELQESWPSWPNLDFNQFAHAANGSTNRALGFGQYPLAGTIGLMTKEFLRCFCRDRDLVYDGDEDALLTRVQKNMFPVTFLHQSRLNNDLCAFLSSLGYPDEILQQIRNRERIYPGRATRPAGEGWHSYYDDELKAFIRQRERILFSLFPEFDD